jgi:hypothetical protein
MRSSRQDLPTIAARVLKGAEIEEAVLLAWTLACGSGVAERTTATAFHNGTLHVLVPDRAWQIQLGSFSGEYCQRLSQLTGAAVTHISYEVGPSHRQQTRS